MSGRRELQDSDFDNLGPVSDPFVWPDGPRALPGQGFRGPAIVEAQANMSRANFVLHSALTPGAVAEALRQSIDEEHWTLFSLSGYKGSRPLLGEVGETTFRVQKRRYTRNDFAGHFYARYAPEPSGTRIEGYFDAPRWARYFMRIWLGAAVLIGTPLFVETVLDVTTGSHHMSGDKLVGLLVPPALVLFGIVLPKIGRLFGKADRRFIVDQIQNILAARMEEPESRLEMVSATR